MNLTKLTGAHLMKCVTLGYIVGLTSLILLGCAPVYHATSLTTVRYSGSVNTPSAAMIDGVLTDVVNFWSRHYPTHSVRQCLKVWRFIFSDDEKICQLGVCGRALTYSVGTSIIGYRNQWGYVEALVGHEAGHAVLSCQGIPDDSQHDEMKRLNYVHQ